MVAIFSPHLYIPNKTIWVVDAIHVMDYSKLFKTNYKWYNHKYLCRKLMHRLVRLRRRIKFLVGNCGVSEIYQANLWACHPNVSKSVLYICILVVCVIYINGWYTLLFLSPLHMHFRSVLLCPCFLVVEVYAIDVCNIWKIKFAKRFWVIKLQGTKYFTTEFSGYMVLCTGTLMMDLLLFQKWLL